MPAEQADGFADNWAYLRTELHWLERLLMAAVAKQRKEAKEIDRVAQSKADRATSHWWKGIITPEGEVSYDEYRQPAGSGKTSHSHQMETQIQATHRQGVVLALPALRERLGLSWFEKNVVLMSLAPEVNRRYAKLYRYLQGEDTTKNDLPSLDLVLRLLCKNDQEWRSARNHLISGSRLTRQKLMQFLPASENTLLNSSLKLAEPLVNYLLTDQPTLEGLDELLKLFPAAEVKATSAQPLVRKVSRVSSLVFLQEIKPTGDWTDLGLPTVALDALQGLQQRIQGFIKAAQRWELPSKATQPGLLVALSGDTHAKVSAAAALAAALNTRLLQVNLATVEPFDYAELLEEIATASPTVLLIESAQLWLKRSSLLSTAMLQRFWTERRQVPAITLFSVAQPAAIQVYWRQQLDQQIDLPAPGREQRLLIWQEAFPSQVPLEASINWPALAELPLSTAEIRLIGQEAMAYAAANEAESLGLQHILQALAQRGRPANIKPISVRSKRRSKKSS